MSSPILFITHCCEWRCIILQYHHRCIIWPLFHWGTEESKYCVWWQILLTATTRVSPSLSSLFYHRYFTASHPFQPKLVFSLKPRLLPVPFLFRPSWNSHSQAGSTIYNLKYFTWQFILPFLWLMCGYWEGENKKTVPRKNIKKFWKNCN